MALTCQIITKYPAIFHLNDLTILNPWSSLNPSYSARQRADHYFHPAWKLGWCAGGGNGPVGWAVVGWSWRHCDCKTQTSSARQAPEGPRMAWTSGTGWLSLLDVLDVLESFAGVLLFRSSFSIWGNFPKNVGGSWHFPFLETEASHLPSFQGPSILVYSSSLSFWRESKEGGQEIVTIYRTNILGMET